MRINENKKAIINEVSNGTVFDFLSFVQIFYKNDIYKYDFESIQEKKKADFDKQKIEDIIERYRGKSWTKTELSSYFSNLRPTILTNNTQVLYTDEDFLKKRKELTDWSIDKKNFFFQIKISGQLFSINPFDDEIYVISNFGLMMDYIEVCDLLKANGYIDFKDTVITKELAGIFAEKSLIKEQRYNQSIEINGVPLEKPKLNSLDFSFGNSLSYETIYKRDFEYASEKLKENTTLISICRDYLGKQIIVKNSLKNFVRNGYVSFEEFAFNEQIKLNKKAFYISIATLVVSIIFSIISIFVTINTNKDNTKAVDNYHNEQKEVLNEITSILNKISEKEDGIDINELYKIKNDIIKEISKYLRKK